MPLQECITARQQRQAYRSKLHCGPESDLATQKISEPVVMACFGQALTRAHSAYICAGQRGGCNLVQQLGGTQWVLRQCCAHDSAALMHETVLADRGFARPCKSFQMPHRGRSLTKLAVDTATVCACCLCGQGRGHCQLELPSGKVWAYNLCTCIAMIPARSDLVLLSSVLAELHI